MSGATRRDRVHPDCALLSINKTGLFYSSRKREAWSQALQARKRKRGISSSVLWGDSSAATLGIDGNRKVLEPESPARRQRLSGGHWLSKHPPQLQLQLPLSL